MARLVRSWEEEEFHCCFARALLEGTNSDYMNQYLLGSVEPMAVAKMINHNNLFHKGKTADQMAKLCEIVNEKTQYGYQIDKRQLIILVRNALVAIQNQAAEGEKALRTQKQVQNCPIFQRKAAERLQMKPVSLMRLTHHQNATNDEVLNLDNFILNPYDPNSGELPVFSVTHANYNQQNQNDDVIITGVVPSSLSELRIARKRRREN
uniref:Bromo domain-containing protein n=1 Tax=Caenorhabditis tropicalis TaxID=1561998 RepID=A0A1I7T0G0_9PELO